MALLPEIFLSIQGYYVCLLQASIKPVPGSGTPGLRIPTSTQTALANASGLQSVQVAGRQVCVRKLNCFPVSFIASVFFKIAVFITDAVCSTC